jgi:hypothetical protein
MSDVRYEVGQGGTGVLLGAPEGAADRDGPAGSGVRSDVHPEPPHAPPNILFMYPPCAECMLKELAQDCPRPFDPAGMGGISPGQRHKPP